MEISPFLHSTRLSTLLEMALGNVQTIFYIKKSKNLIVLIYYRNQTRQTQGKCPDVSARLKAAFGARSLFCLLGVSPNVWDSLTDSSAEL